MIKLKLVAVICTVLLVSACTKHTANSNNDCFPNAATIKTVTNVEVIVKKIEDGNFHLVEAGTIDNQYYPCNLPDEFKVDNLNITISGDIKDVDLRICCTEAIVLTSIKK